MSQWAYGMSNEDLLKEFANACGKSGIANCGIVIDAAGSMYAEEVGYLRGVVLSKLDGVDPPFKRDDIVRAEREISDSKHETSLLQNSKSTIRRIHYNSNGKWFLEFKDGSWLKGRPLLFSATWFILEPSDSSEDKP